MAQNDGERALAELISEAADGPMTFEVAIELLGQMTDALVEMDRQNVFYATLNPYNIWVSSGSGIRFQGSGNSGSEIPRNAETHFARTLPYLSPEAVQGMNGALDIRSDIYSIGAVAYHMLSGHRVIEARTIRAYIDAVVLGLRQPASFYNPNLSPDCVDFLNRCLEVHPDDRYQTPFEMLIAVEDLGQGALLRTTAVLRSLGGKTYPVPRSGGILGRYDVERKLPLAVDLSGEEDGRMVSRQQAKLGCIRGRWVIVPCLRTTNATVLNGRPLESGMQYGLTDGDELQIASLKLVLQLQ